MSVAKDNEKERDNFWLYVGLAAVTLIAVILYIKEIESGKYDHVKQLQEEETRLMNIRVLGEH